MNTQLIHNGTDTLKDQEYLFVNGTPLPSIEVKKTPPSKYHTDKPYTGVLCNNLDEVIAKQDFDGEPFLKGRYEYMEVVLPQARSSIYKLYKVILAIINGVYVSQGGDKDSLTTLANQLFHDYAPKRFVFRECEERRISFSKIESIVDKVLQSPQPFKGKKKTAKIIWNPDYCFSPKQKSTIHNQYRGRENKKNTLAELQAKYAKGTTQVKLAEQTGKSLRTIKRYWKQLNVA